MRKNRKPAEASAFGTSELVSHVEAFANAAGLIIDWDQEDGEQWGRLLYEQKVVMLFNAKLPLLFVDTKFYLKALRYFEDNVNNLVVQEVQSWETADNTIDISVVGDVIQWHSSISTKNFSLNDFWYATV